MLRKIIIYNCILVTVLLINFTIHGNAIESNNEYHKEETIILDCNLEITKNLRAEYSDFNYSVNKFGKILVSNSINNKIFLFSQNGGFINYFSCNEIGINCNLIRPLSSFRDGYLYFKVIDNSVSSNRLGIYQFNIGTMKNTFIRIRLPEHNSNKYMLVDGHAGLSESLTSYHLIKTKIIDDTELLLFMNKRWNYNGAIGNEYFIYHINSMNNKTNRFQLFYCYELYELSDVCFSQKGYTYTIYHRPNLIDNECYLFDMLLNIYNKRGDMIARDIVIYQNLQKGFSLLGMDSKETLYFLRFSKTNDLIVDTKRIQSKHLNINIKSINLNYLINDKKKESISKDKIKLGEDDHIYFLSYPNYKEFLEKPKQGLKILKMSFN